MSHPQVVITGVGVVSPIGIGRQAFWESLRAGRSGVRALDPGESESLRASVVADVRDFDPKQYVRPRKSLKVMARDAQLSVTAADLARADAGIGEDAIDPDRLGVILGADRIRNELEDIADTYRVCSVAGRFSFERWGGAGMEAAFPLMFLKNLPNMLPSHVSILHDARGPNNTIHLASVSGLLAVAEATSVIQRGAADVMLVGAAASRLHPIDWARAQIIRQVSRRSAPPEAVSRPFDRRRDGEVRGEGAAVFVLESRAHAEARGATMLARVVSWGSSYEARLNGCTPSGAGLARAIRAALAGAGLSAAEIGHVNAHGLSTTLDDRLESRALADALPNVPVTAPKSYFGNLGVGSGAVEMAASVLALGADWVPPTLNYEDPDPDCPVAIIRDRGASGLAPVAMLVNQTTTGQAAALVIAGP